MPEEIKYTSLELTPLQYKYKDVQVLEPLQLFTNEDKITNTSFSTTTIFGGIGSGTTLHDVYGSITLIGIYPTTSIAADEILYATTFRVSVVRVGNPPAPLVFGIKPLGAMDVGFNYTTSANLSQPYGAQTFTVTRTGKLTGIAIWLNNTSSNAQNVWFQIRNQTADGKPGTTIYKTSPTFSLPASTSGVIFWLLDSPLDVNAGDKLTLVVYAPNSISRASINVYPNGTFYVSTDGSTWSDTGLDAFYFYVFVRTAEQEVFQEKSISFLPSEVPTTQTTISKDFEAYVPSGYYAVIARVLGNLGDSSNKYQLAYDQASSSTTWKAGPSYLPFTIFNLTSGGSRYYCTLSGYKPKQIYSGSLNNADKKSALGEVRLRIIVNTAVISGTAGIFALVGDKKAKMATTTSTSPVDVEVFPASESIDQSDTLSVKIYALGNALFDYVQTQRYIYNTKNPIYPKDFGKAELYLGGYMLKQYDGFMINDDKQSVYFNLDSSTVSRNFSDAFRIKVKKLEIIHGTPIIDLWGVE